MKVFDFHCRIGAGDRAADELLRAMTARGIARAAVSRGGLLDLATLSRQIIDGGRADVRADNEHLLDQCAGSGGRLLPFFLADPASDLPAYRRTAGAFRGLELSPAVHGFRLDEPAVVELAAVAADVGHPVYVACLGRPGARAADLATLARKVPDTTVVWGHCGHTGLDVAGLEEIAGEPNIVAETSGCFTATARLAVRRLGARRVLFGSAQPLQDPRVELTKIRALDLDPADRHAVTWGNACRVLNEETTWTRQ